MNTECAHCGKKESYDIRPEKSRMMYVGMGNYYCVTCFARTNPYRSEKIWFALEKLREASRVCKHCGKKYRSDYNLNHICDKCAKQSWDYVLNLDGKMEVRNWKAFMKIQNKKEKEGRLLE